MLKQVLDQQHAVGMQQNEMGGQLAKMAATHALGQHDKAQAAAQAPPVQMTPPGAPQAPEPQGDA